MNTKNSVLNHISILNKVKNHQTLYMRTYTDKTGKKAKYILDLEIKENGFKNEHKYNQFVNYKFKSYKKTTFTKQYKFASKETRDYNKDRIIVLSALLGVSLKKANRRKEK